MAEYLEVECEHCGHILWSDRSDEIEEWKELMEEDKLRCPYCDGLFKLKKIKGNGGGNAFLSTSTGSHPPPPASALEMEGDHEL